MTGEERRIRILSKLQESPTPMSGTALAKAFHVSRQIIVQDITVLKGSGYNILSTHNGYIIQKSPLNSLLE